MAIDIIVSRAPDDKKGPDIVDGILSDTIVAILRGTKEIDDNEPTVLVSMSCKYRTGVQKGNIVEVLDELQGTTWRGKIIAITHTIREADIWTDLSIERPTRFYP